MAKKPVSIRDVATQAGVSIGTVSHVLNGNTKARISKVTQDRIRSAAKELGYRPNQLARSLWRGKTDTIGLLISGFRNPFFVDVVESAESAVLACGYRVQSASAPSAHGTFRAHADVFNWPVDGVIMWADAGQTLATYMGPRAAQTPVVYIGSIRTDDTDWIGFDSYGGGRLLTEHLVAKGYRKIAYAYPADWQPGHEDVRFLAFRDVCSEAGITPRTLLTANRDETCSAGLDLGLAIARMRPSDRPDAVFCHNDTIAMGVYSGLRRAGLRVPDDVAVAGCDGIEFAQCLEAPLTTIRIPGEKIAEQAMHVLNTRLKSEAKPAQRVQTILPTELWVGGTT
ncbi:MAG: LacI family DNA-binding transcriptional regulator [Armatimonadetes bacterium]|nr:LacI family DNA-binding transcriptional regulator [Armatimonadota bacterium]